MLLFVLTFLAIYTAMHALVFWGMHPLLAGHPALPSLAWIWMGAMIVAPLIVRLLDHSGHELAARGLAWIGYSWMGFAFIAFSLCTLLGLWEILAWLLPKISSGLPRLSIHGAISAGVILLITLATGLYGLHEANDLQVDEVRLASAKLPPGTKPLRIVQISDLHLGLIHREEALAPIISRLQQLQPDLLLATGDIVDAQINHLDGLSDLWKRLDPPLGKFVVTGNHEVYAGLEQSLDFLSRSGFVVLRNRTETVGDRLTLVGVDDPATGHAGDEASLLKDVPADRFTILMKHRPRIAEAAAELFDLQLSGHTHRGQIYPFNYLTGLEYPLQNGLYRAGSSSHLYTSRGTGTWGPPMRVLSPPEITLFEISPEAAMK